MTSRNPLWCGVVVIIVVCLLSSSVLADCLAVVVGKDASFDGSVLVGHDEQNGGRRFLNFRKTVRIPHESGETVLLRAGGTIPQIVGQTNAFLWSENPGMSPSDGYLNEYGVAVVSDTCWPREYNTSWLESQGYLVDGGIHYMLRRLIMERSTTAREGINVAAGIIAQVGYSGKQTMVIADPNEAWIFSTVPGMEWVAQRVPDDQVVVLPNVHIINEVDLTDTANFMASPRLVDYAVERGWYTVPTEPELFPFAEVYSDSRSCLMDNRQRRGQIFITGEEIPWQCNQRLPFSVEPDHLITIGDVMEIMRYHGDGSICYTGTQEAAVFQLNGDLPADIGCKYWRTSAEPCTSVITPWYVGVTDTPQTYYKPVGLTEHLTLSYHFDNPYGYYSPDINHAWWSFKRLQDQVRENYDTHMMIVRRVWDGLEADLMAEQSAVDAFAAALYATDPQAARAYLTRYSRGVALGAVRKAEEMGAVELIRDTVALGGLTGGDNPMVIKSVLLTTSTRLTDFRTELTRYDENNVEVPVTYDSNVPLDLNHGEGCLLARRAYGVLISGEGEPGAVNSQGWDLNTLSETSEPLGPGEKKYWLPCVPDLPDESRITGTLVWDLSNANLSNLDMALYRLIGTELTQVDISNELTGNVERITFDIDLGTNPGPHEYVFGVWAASLPVGSEGYGFSWHIREGAMDIANRKFATGDISGWFVNGYFGPPSYVDEAGTVEVVADPTNSGNHVARLTAGSPVSITQEVDTPEEAFYLTFDYLFESTDGELKVYLEESLIGTITAPASLADEFQAGYFFVDDPLLLDEMDMRLCFLFDGPEGAGILLDNIAAVPEPASCTLVFCAFALTVLRKNRRRGR